MKHPKLISEIESVQWAITEDALAGIYKAIDQDLSADDYELFHRVSLSDKKNIVADLGTRPEGTAYSFVQGNVGILMIDGPIIPRGDSFSAMSGLVSIDTLSSEFKAFEEDEAIGRIVLLLDTPGGAISGVSNFAKLVSNSEKETTSFVMDMAASAGYWIASSADELVSSDTGIVGSIGVIMSMRERDSGRITFISSQSPLKQSDPKSKEGAKSMQTVVNDLGAVFVGVVAGNRSVSAETVLSDFGQGSIVVAGRALQAGMIDRIDTLESVLSGQPKEPVEPPNAINVTVQTDNNTGVTNSEIPAVAGNKGRSKEMATLKEVLAENPAIAVEIDEMTKSATEAGKQSIQTRIDAAAPYLAVESSYPGSIKKIALSVLNGEADPSFLSGAIVAYEALNEQQNTNAAVEDSDDAGNTAAQSDKVSTDGVIRNPDEFASAVSGFKAALGREVH